MVKKLTKKKAYENLRKLKEWKIEKDRFSGIPALNKKFEFKDFSEALKFVNKVAGVAEKYGHHPDIHLILYNKLVITIYTHSVKGLTNWDFELAELIDKIKL